MKYLKLFEAFKSDKLSKLWKFYKEDDYFKDYIKKYCDQNNMALSDIDDNCFELLDIPECIEKIQNEFIGDGEYYSNEEKEGNIYWFNDKLGLCFKTDLVLKNDSAINNVYAIPNFNWGSYYNISEKIKTITNCFDYAIILYKKETGVSKKRYDRKNNKPSPKLGDEQLRKMNISKYINILADRIDIKPEDKSLLSNFKPVIDKYFSVVDPILVLSENDIFDIGNYIKPYIEIFTEDYEDYQYLIDRIKDRFKKLYSSRKRKLPERDLVLSTLTLDEQQIEIINRLYDISDKLKEFFKNYKFETIDDLYIFKRTLKTLSMREDYYIDGDLLEYLYHSYDDPSSNFRRVANYFSSRNKNDSKLMIRQLERYKNLLDRISKNNI